MRELEEKKGLDRERHTEHSGMKKNPLCLRGSENRVSFMVENLTAEKLALDLVTKYNCFE